MNVRLIASTITLVALLFAPQAALAQRGPAARPTQARWSVLAGVEDGDGDAGLQLRGDLELVQRPLSPEVGFSVVGSLAFTRFHEEWSDVYLGFGDRFETTANVLKAIPAARFTFGRSSAFRPYLDAGLGLYFVSWSAETTDVYYGTSFKADDSDVGIVLRLGAGATFQVSPDLSLGVELGLLPYLGDYVDDTTMSALVSATFRL
jgi:opacity protein-like surface antigen